MEQGRSEIAQQIHADLPIPDATEASLGPVIESTIRQVSERMAGIHAERERILAEELAETKQKLEEVQATLDEFADVIKVARRFGREERSEKWIILRLTDMGLIRQVATMTHLLEESGNRVIARCEKQAQKDAVTIQTALRFAFDGPFFGSYKAMAMDGDLDKAV